MTDQFVPLALPAPSSKHPGFASLDLKFRPQAAGATALSTPPVASPGDSHSPENCSNPTVALQRNGDIVSGIRIQCGCGKVIELTCLY
jgi:hypothetical protein